jgi:hypothetical protein
MSTARCLTLAFAWILITCSSALQIISPIEYLINTPSSESTGPIIYNITGELVITDPINSCRELTNAHLVLGKIALVSNDRCPLEIQTRYAQQAGAIAIIQHQSGVTEAGRDYYSYTLIDRDDILIPVAFVDGYDGDFLHELIQNSTSVIVILSSGDRNTWQIFATSPVAIVLTVLHVAIDLGILIYAIVKLVRYTRYTRSTISVTQVSLGLIMLAMAIAIVMVIVIRLGSFNFMDVPTALILGSIFFPDTMMLLSSLVVSFYWFELTSKVSPVSRTWSKKLWRPFIAGGVVLMALLAMIIIWTQLIRSNAVLIAIYAIYTVITLGVAVIWVVFGAKLRKALVTDRSAKVQKSSKRITKVIILIFVCAASLIITRITAAFASAAPGSPTAFTTILQIGHFSLEITAITQLLLFKTHNLTGSSKSTVAPQSSDVGGAPLVSPRILSNSQASVV